MPWTQHHVPRYRKHRASGQAIVTFAGRDVYLGPHGTKASKLLYDRLIGEWLQKGRTTDAGNDQTLIVVELCARYMRYAQVYYRKNGKPTGAIHGVKAAVRYLKDWYGRDPVQDFGPLALKTVRQRMVDAGLSRRYINDLVDRIKRIFKWGVGEELVDPAVYQALATVAGLRRDRSDARETAPVPPVADEIVDDTLPHLPDVVADMVRLQRLAGMRPAELCQLRPCDLDRQGDVWLYRPESHKTQHHGRERVILLGPKAQAILLRYLARDAQDYCFRPCDSEAKRRAARHAARKTPLKYGNRPGTNRRANPQRQPRDCYTSDSYRRAITRACEKAKLPRWSPNQLRHAAATEIRREFGLEAAQVILGHSNAAVTQIYAERDIAKGVEVARRIG